MNKKTEKWQVNTKNSKTTCANKGKAKEVSLKLNANGIKNTIKKAQGDNDMGIAFAKPKDSKKEELKIMGGAKAIKKGKQEKT